MIQAGRAKPLLENPEAPASLNHDNQADTEDFLIASPYTSLPHLLDLRALNTAQQLLSKALTILEAVRADYATAPYAEAFNWAAIFARLKDLVQQQNYPWERQHFYIIVFRSRIPPTTSRLSLHALDARSHAEATQSGGLLKYWFGTPDANGRNLATCIWRAHTDARPASTGAGHRAAVRATVSLYTEWKIERLRLEIGDGVGDWGVGGLSILEWED